MLRIHHWNGSMYSKNDVRKWKRTMLEEHQNSDSLKNSFCINSEVSRIAHTSLHHKFMNWIDRNKSLCRNQTESDCLLFRNYQIIHLSLLKVLQNTELPKSFDAHGLTKEWYIHSSLTQAMSILDWTVVIVWRHWIKWSKWLF